MSFKLGKFFDHMFVVENRRRSHCPRAYFGLKEDMVVYENELTEMYGASFVDQSEEALRAAGYYQLERRKFRDLIDDFISEYDKTLGLSELKELLAPLDGWEYETAFRRYIDHMSLLPASVDYETGVRRYMDHRAQLLNGIEIDIGVCCDPDYQLRLYDAFVDYQKYVLTIIMKEWAAKNHLE